MPDSTTTANPRNLTKDEKEETKWTQEGMRFRLEIETDGAGCVTDGAPRPHPDAAGRTRHPPSPLDGRYPPAQGPAASRSPRPRRSMLYGMRADIEQLAGRRDRCGRRGQSGRQSRSSSSSSHGTGRPQVHLRDHGVPTTSRSSTASSTPSARTRTTSTAHGAPRSSTGSRRTARTTPSTAAWSDPTRPLPPGRSGRRRSGHVLRRSRGAPRRRSVPFFRAEQAGLHRQPRRCADPAGPGAARHRQELHQRLRHAGPDAGRDGRRAGLPGHPLLQDPRGDGRAAGERRRGPGDACADAATSTPTSFERYFDPRLLDVPCFRLDPREQLPDGDRPLRTKTPKASGDPKAVLTDRRTAWCVVGATPGGVYSLIRDAGARSSSATTSSTPWCSTRPRR